MRQLENICHWLTVMAPAQVVEAKDLPPELQPHGAPRRARRRRCRADAAARPRRRRRRARRGRDGRAAVGRDGCRVAAPVGAAAAAAPALPTRAGSPAWSARRGSCCAAGEPMVWDTLTRKFEAQLIHTALEITRGRRIEAAQKLGIGRNTITRKIQELGLEE